ncbi:Zinc-iron permease, partial [Globisporangium splendens]
MGLQLKTLSLMLLALVSAACLPLATSQHDHEAEEESSTTSPWETATIWEFAADNYTLRFCAANDEVVVEGGMIFELLALPSTEESDADAAMHQAEAIFNTFSSDQVLHQSVTTGTTLTMKTAASNNSSSSRDVLYRVEFSAEQPCVDAIVPVSTAGAFMLLTQHGGDEVSVEVMDSTSQVVSFLECHAGCDEEEESDTKSDSWLGPIVASLVISLTSFVGVIILSFSKSRIESIVEYMTSFAAGCLLGVVVFHLYPEGSEYLGDVGEWVMGVWVLGGIAFSMAVESGVHMLLSSFGADHHDHAHGGHRHSQSHALTHGEDAEKGLARSSLQQPRATEGNYVSHPLTPDVHHGNNDDAKLNHQSLTFLETYIKSLRFVEPVAWITAIGDFFHAFTDGVVLAVAFKSCSTSLGWAVALGVVLHEVPHRVGDFFIYLKAGMVVAQALFVNFLASLASLLGAVILLAAGTVSAHALGYLMGFGCGALLFIGLSVLLPPMLGVRDRRRALLHFLWFSLGCILIGLSTLQHKHCDAEGSGLAHSH